MAVVNVNGISGINSITAQSNALDFYNSAGNTLSIGANLTGNVTGNATGLSGTPNITVGTIAATSLNASGVVTATSFSGSGANLTGIAATTNVVTNSLVVSGITTVAAGSSAAPSITPTGDTDTGIFFPSADTIAFGEGGVETMRVNSSGELLIGTSTRTANGGVLQVSNGITFPATQSACSDVNTLDDYEEGTFTATVVGSSTPGTASYSGQVAKYTKVGRLVHFEIVLDWSSGTGTGNLLITGMPFTVGSGLTYPGLTVGYLANIALTASNVATASMDNTVYIRMFQYPVGGGAVTAVPYDASGTIVLTGSYAV